MLYFSIDINLGVQWSPAPWSSGPWSSAAWSNPGWPSSDAGAAVAAAQAAAEGVRRAQHEADAARQTAIHQQKLAAAKEAAANIAIKHRY